MPEISQDAFEILNPVLPPISSSDLRSRTNSLGVNKKFPAKTNKTQINFCTKHLIAKDTSENSKNMASSSDKTPEMDHQTLLNGLTAIDTVAHSYKRVLDHR